MARSCWFSLSLLLFACSTIFAQDAQPARDEADARQAKELKWAEGIALDFLEAAASGDSSQAEALIGPALKQSHDFAREPQALRQWLNNKVGIRQLGKPTIKSSALSPSGSEAVFRGELTNEERSTPFTLRVAKEKEIWMVSFLRIHPVAVAEQETPAKEERGRLIDVRPVPVRPAKRKTPAQLLFGDIPDKFSTYVVACYEGIGEELDVYIDDESVSVRQTDVVVNKPGEDVVLVLTSRESNVWRVGHTKGTRIVGVMLSGHHAQAIYGLASDVPIVTSTANRRGAFTPFFAEDLLRDTPTIERILSGQLGVVPTAFVHNRGHGYFIGTPPKRDEEVIYSKDKSLEDVTKKLPVPRGRRGLQQLVKDKKIRRATQADIDAWVDKARENPKLVGPNLEVHHHMGPERTFVVLAETSVPHGLAGADGVAYLVPVGIPAPIGPSHIELYFMDGTKR